MKKSVACFLFLMILPLFSIAQEQAQIELVGKVKDSESQSPLAGCHVFLDRQLGTVSDMNGEFKLKIPVSYITDDVHFSYVGYHTESIPVNDLSTGFNTIEMAVEVVMLDEVVVIADPWSEFRTIVAELSSLYPDKEDFLDNLLKELDKIDPGLGSNLSQALQ